MNHWIVAPVLIPAATAILLLLTARADRNMHRAASVLSTLGLVGVSIALAVFASNEGREVYSFGAWPVPLGILFVLDQLSSLMVLLTSVTGLGALLYAIHGIDNRGKNFHALFQFQLMGINGAFLTGDVFNLFVFFEILLIASYGLLLHGGGAARIRAGLHYVIFNLTGSALFLFGLGLLYGVVGTLNMADIAVRVSEVAEGNVPVLRAAGLLLMVVFSIKAAALPLYFWLPSTYSSASAPVAALFAIMTKVGLYALLRLSLVLFGVEGGPLSDLIMPWMVPAGLLTLFTAALGAFAARGLRSLVAWLVIVSVGTLIAVFGIPTEQALAAGLYYMLHSTLVVAGMFLLVDLIAKQRGATSDGLVPAAPIAQPAILGSLFFIGAVAIAGMPPLSGFFGKAMILASAVDHPLAPWIFFVVLLGGLLGLVGLGRAGSQVFWKTLPEEPVDDGGDASSRRRATWGLLLPVVYFLQALVLLVVFGGPVHAWMGQIAAQLLDVQGYIDAVFAYAPPGEG